jgi:CheY-like chemotaxis protein
VADLRRAEAALREADRRKDEFLAVLSHELRNPLTPIQNGLYLLGHAAPGSDQARRAQEVIGRQARHLERLVNDLLDVTRIARGKVHLQRATLDLGEALRRAVEDHRPGYAAKGVALSLAVPPDPVWIDGDPTRIAQVAGNLLGNALKFTPPGRSVAVELRREGDEARLVVADEGVGIGRELLGHIFEPFTQADATLARSQGGLGLGLALVKGMVELHGGTVEAGSDGPGRGATFSVRLPAATAVAPVPEAPHRGERAGKRLRILVVEDNEDAASTLREALELLGHEVHVSNDGPAGLEAAGRFAPDVVLCDIGLPGIDGYEVARRLRRLQPGLRLVALSGYALPEDRERARHAGFDAHMAKPPDIDELTGVLVGS